MGSRAAVELVHLPERAAVARSFDGDNERVLRRLLWLIAPAALVFLLVQVTGGRLWEGLSWAPVLAVVVWIVFVREAPFFERYGRKMTLLLIALLAPATVISWPEPEPAYAFAGFVLPLLLLLFRFELGEALALAGIDLGAMAWSLMRDGMPEDVGGRVGMAVGSIFCVAIVFWMAATLTRRARTAFLEVWRREVARERDRSRMRSELEDAREIQLSMLPIGVPELEWADFASVSLPASEVGGDYFDFFELPGARLAIVIGDVAGHGVASGLVLSGVRSSLYLLRDELDRPVEVLAKLDRMLRDSVRGRTFVTLQIAVLEPTLGRVTVANAGHPPLFLVARGGRVHRLGADSLPLGTRLEGEHEEQSSPLGEGDALLLFSDGVPEVRNLHGEGFGEERLLDELRRARPAAGARRIRDALLNALSRFKGDVEQEDDISLVVVKVGTGVGLG
jgi:serine phosphatase RsbU (regulator of sigma subunit)